MNRLLAADVLTASSTSVARSAVSVELSLMSMAWVRSLTAAWNARSKSAGARTVKTNGRTFRVRAADFTSWVIAGSELASRRTSSWSCLARSQACRNSG